jgi:hypothetical protein
VGSSLPARELDRDGDGEIADHLKTMAPTVKA